MKVLLPKNSVLALLIVAGIILGFTSIREHRLIGDELVTLNIATGLGHTPLINNTWCIGPVPPASKVFTQKDYWKRNTLSSVLLNTATFNGTMVGYNILLYYFIKLAYVDDGLLRGLSALFYVISLILVYFIAIRLFKDSRVAFISAALFALNPFLLDMAHNLRCYMFVTMTTLFATWIVLHFQKQDSMNLRTKTGWTLLLGILYGISFLGHYFSMYIFIGHFFYAVYNYFFLKKKFLIPVCAAFFICLLFFIAWLAHGGITGLASMEINDKYMLRVTSAQTHTSLVSLIMATVCFINSVFGYYFQYLGYRNSSFFYVLILPVTSVVLAFNRKFVNKEEKINFIFLGIMIISCLFFLQLCAIRAGHVTSLLFTRFGSFVAPYLMLLLGYSLFKLFYSKNIFFKYISIIILFIHLTLSFLCYKIPFGGYWFTYTDAKGDVEKARNEIVPPNPYPIIAQNIMQHYSAGDTVIYNSYVTSQDVNLYLRDARMPIFQEVNEIQKEDYKIKTFSH
jgi:hypothetical protein